MIFFRKKKHFQRFLSQKKMNKIKIISAKGVFSERIFTLSLIFALAVLSPLLFKNQIIAGSVVNFALYFSILTLGLKEACLIALLPSIISLLTGLLPAFFFPIVPFIILGNLILISIFNFLREKSYFGAVISASVLKFVFLSSSALIVSRLFLSESLSAKITFMMGWPQLITALLGGLISFVLFKARKNGFYDKSETI